MIRRPPRSPPFPSTTLFRSLFRSEFPMQIARDIEVRRASAREQPPAVYWDVTEHAPQAHPSENRPSRCVPNATPGARSEEHTSELQSQSNLVCRLLLEKKKK